MRKDITTDFNGRALQISKSQKVLPSILQVPIFKLGSQKIVQSTLKLAQTLRREEHIPPHVATSIKIEEKFTDKRISSHRSPYKNSTQFNLETTLPGIVSPDQLAKEANVELKTGVFLNTHGIVREIQKPSEEALYPSFVFKDSKTNSNNNLSQSVSYLPHNQQSRTIPTSSFDTFQTKPHVDTLNTSKSQRSIHMLIAQTNISQTMPHSHRNLYSVLPQTKLIPKMHLKQQDY